MSTVAEQPTTASNHDHERHFDRGAWLTLAAALGLMIYSLTYILVVFTAPTDGWWAEEIVHETGDTYRLVINQSGRPSSIREGDVLLAVNGQGPETFSANYKPVVPPDKPVVYTLEREGRVVDVVVPLVRRSFVGILQVSAYRWRESPFQILTPLVFFILGAFIFWMRPGNLGGRFVFLIGTFLFCGFWAYADSAVLQNLYPPMTLWWSTWHTGSWAFFFFPWWILLILAFPRPIGPLRRFPRLTPALATGIPLAVILAATIPYLMSRDPADLTPVDDVIGLTVFALVLVLVITLVAAMVYHFRATSDHPLGRAQLRWFALGVVLGVGGMFVALAVSITLTLIGRPPGGAGLEIALNIFLLFLPLCLAIAILRYRLFDIDLVIRKTLQYTIVTGLLLLVYLGTVIVLQSVFTRLTGSDSTAVVVLSTLLIAALFNPVRRRVQDAIDRRFFRKKYDAEKILQEFAATVRDETDLDALTAELLRVIQETMQPEHVSIWLRPAGAVTAASVEQQDTS